MSSRYMYACAYRAGEDSSSVSKPVLLRPTQNFYRQLVLRNLECESHCLDFSFYTSFVLTGHIVGLYEVCTCYISTMGACLLNLASGKYGKYWFFKVKRAIFLKESSSVHAWRCRRCQC